MLKKYLLASLILYSTTYANTTYVTDINYKIKNKTEYQSMVNLYNEYHFEEMKDILTFFNHNKFYRQFKDIFETMTLEEQSYVIETIIDYPYKYKELIYNLDLYSKLFSYSNNYEVQEFQFKIYDLLLDNPDNYVEFLTYSRITTHYDVIFNPNNLVNIDPRYRHYIKKFIMAEYPISYVNSIQYLFLNEDRKLELKKFGFNRHYEMSLDRLKVNDTIGYVPITVSTIFYDKSNQYKTIKVDYNFYIKTNIKYFLENINEKGFIAKYSHDLLKNYFKETIIKSQDKKDYLEMLNIKEIEIEDTEDFLYIEINENGKKEIYKDIDELLKNHSMTFIY